MVNVELGDECIVGALSFIKADEKIERRTLLAGNPAKVIREVTDEMIAWKTKGTDLYQQLPAEMKASWKACEPLNEIPEFQPSQEFLYKTWNEIRRGKIQ